MNYEEEEEEPHGFMHDKDKKFLREWLADPKKWNKISLGQGYEGGAKLVTVEGDGNCFFSSVSTHITASKGMPDGTTKRAYELRQKACDWIVKNKSCSLL